MCVTCRCSHTDVVHATVYHLIYYTFSMEITRGHVDQRPARVVLSIHRML